MKKQLKSLLATAVALSLSLGFTACKNNDPEPGPTPTEKKYVFNNGISFSTTMTDVYDITIELTDLEGKVTTTNIKDCPQEKRTYDGKDMPVYTFSTREITTTKPAQTTAKIKFVLKSDIPVEGNFDSYVEPYFFVGIPDQAETGWTAIQSYTTIACIRGLRYEQAAEHINTLISTYSHFLLKVDKEGKLHLER